MDNILREQESNDRHFARLLLILMIGLCFIIQPFASQAQSLDIPSSKYGISFGNSKEFNGLRFNFRDKHVKEINGVNVTFWGPKENDMAVINGVSLGVMPGGGNLHGIQLGIAGVGAEENVKGVTLGLLGAGAGGSISGITIGGLGAGSGQGMKGIIIGGLGAGSGGDVTGIAFGGLGVGSGGDLKGVAIGLLGAGASGDATGILLGGLGAGCGGEMKGLGLGLLGLGSGKGMTGIYIGGVGIGTGGEMKGIMIGGIGGGAPKITGLAFGGAGLGSKEVMGIMLSVGRIKIEDDGYLKGMTISGFNQIHGKQSGISLGIVNYARELKGVQLGLINYVRENPSFLKILPVINVGI